MLGVEERFVIKELYKKGVSISEIARLTGYDRKTIRRIVAEPLLPPKKERCRRAHKLGPFRPHLERRLAEGVFNARKLYGEIKAVGYEGGETQVRAFVHPFRQERLCQATVRFETEPGEQAQVDWGHFGMIEHYGRSRRLYAFVVTLGWSRAMYVEFTVSADIAHFLRCHLHAFHYFGGVPREVLHDNLKTAVLERDGDGAIHWHPRYLDFAGYYGFAPRACAPYRAQTKGKVESGVKYVRGNFWLGLSFTDLLDLNAQAWAWLDTVANQRLHGTTGQVPWQLLAQEGLSAIAAKPDYDTSLITYCKSSSDCLISFEGNYYSVPSRMHSQTLQVKANEGGELTVLSPEGETIATHRLALGHKQRIIVPEHYQGISTRTPRPRRSGAIQIETHNLASDTLLGDAPQVQMRELSFYDALLAERLELAEVGI